MKQFLPVVWWLTATLVIAFVLVGLGYLFADALLLGVLFLPGMLTARYFVPQLSFENRRQGILDTVYLALAVCRRSAFRSPVRQTRRVLLGNR